MSELIKLRKQIKETDARIVKELALRQELSKQIGRLKLQQGKPIIDLEQEKKMFEFYNKLSEHYELPNTFIMKVFKLIIAYSRRVQKL